MVFLGLHDSSGGNSPKRYNIAKTNDKQINLVVMIFLFPETRYRRAVNGSSNTEFTTTTLNLEAKESIKETATQSVTDEVTASDLSRMGETQELRTGRPSKEQFSLIPRLEYEGSQMLFRDVVAPIQIFFFPIILWAALSLGFAANCLLALNLTQSQVFAAPPYNFSPAQVGFVNFAFVVGGIVGLLTAGPVSDWISMRATMRNKGVREAEFRLVALLPYISICLVGMTVSFFALEFGKQLESSTDSSRYPLLDTKGTGLGKPLWSSGTDL